MALTKSLPTSTQREEPLTLLTLPQELQDIIFDYAYPGQDGVQHVTPGVWKARMAYRRTGTHLPSTRSFPELVVDLFFVSEAFFKVASKAYAKNQVSTGFTSLRDMKAGTIVYDFALQAHLDGERCSAALELPHLKHLIIDIKFRLFNESFEEDALTKVFSDADLETLEPCKLLVRHRSLQRVTTVPETGGTSVWLQNVQALENLINKILKETTVERAECGKAIDHERMHAYVPTEYVYTPTAAAYVPTSLIYQPTAIDRRFVTSPVGPGQLRGVSIPEDGISLTLLVVNRTADVLAWIKDAKAAEAARLAEKKAAEVQRESETSNNEVQQPGPATLSMHYTTLYDCESTEAQPTCSERCSRRQEGALSANEVQETESRRFTTQYMTVYDRRESVIIKHGKSAGKPKKASTEHVEQAAQATKKDDQGTSNATSCAGCSGPTNTSVGPQNNVEDASIFARLDKGGMEFPAYMLVFLLALCVAVLNDGRVGPVEI